ncbi:MAG: hypothetical protein AAF629_04570 [Chloroflexota bacterium]
MSFTNDLDLAAHAEHYKDLLKEADKDRLVQKIKKQRRFPKVADWFSLTSLKPQFTRTAEPVSEEVCTSSVAYS